MRDSDLVGEFSDYFDYIMGLVGGGEWWDDLGENMARLFERKYYWRVELDENAAKAGLNLRNRFVEGLVPIDEASVLEVLVALALNVDDKLMYTPRFGHREPVFFDMIIRKLGFDVDISALDEQIDMFLDGETLLDERAGPGATLWEQVNLMFSENFDLENEEFQW